MQPLRDLRLNHFYPRSPRGERRVAGIWTALPVDISIHAPREGSDLAMQKANLTWKISIHAPREGSDACCWARDISAALFLSTLPARGATLRSAHVQCISLDFYPRSPRGERQGDFIGALYTPKFLSTLPARGATGCISILYGGVDISIHAPREGSDGIHAVLLSKTKHFYPRSPRGERLWPTVTLSSVQSNFYPRSPRGERLERW